jgi:hypothetical protein
MGLAEWIGLWAGIAGLFIGVYSAAIVPESRPRLEQFFKRSRLPALLAQSIYISAQIPAHLFGRKLLSIRSVLVSIGVSGLIFTLAYVVADVTTPGLRGFLLKSLPKLPETLLPPELVSSLKITVLGEFIIETVVLVAVGFFLEFVLLCKSRLLLRLIKFESSVAWNTGVLAVDLVTAVLLFVLVLPFVFVAIDGLELLLIASRGDVHQVYIPGQTITPDKLDFGCASSPAYYNIPAKYPEVNPEVEYSDKVCRVSEVLPNGIPSFSSNPAVYVARLESSAPQTYRYHLEWVWASIIKETRSGFSLYIAEEEVTALMMKYRVNDHRIDGPYFVGSLMEIDGHTLRPTSEQYPVIVVPRRLVPFSTMLFGAMATTVWLVLATTCILLVRIVAACFNSVRRSIFWLHENPELMFIAGVVSLIVMGAGIVVIEVG